MTQFKEYLAFLIGTLILLRLGSVIYLHQSETEQEEVVDEAAFRVTIESNENKTDISDNINQNTHRNVSSIFAPFTSNYQNFNILSQSYLDHFPDFYDETKVKDSSDNDGESLNHICHPITCIDPINYF